MAVTLIWCHYIEDHSILVSQVKSNPCNSIMTIAGWPYGTQFSMITMPMQMIQAYTFEYGYNAVQYCKALHRSL